MINKETIEKLAIQKILINTNGIQHLFQSDQEFLTQLTAFANAIIQHEIDSSEADIWLTEKEAKLLKGSQKSDRNTVPVFFFPPNQAADVKEG